MDLREFVDEGFLQEVNRQFFHPLGLSMAVSTADGINDVRFDGIYDYRDTPEGTYFNESVLSAEKAAKVYNLLKDTWPIRLRELGYWVQPIGEGK
jgi:hypothetical protein